MGEEKEMRWEQGGRRKAADMDQSCLLDLLAYSLCLERLSTTARVLPCQPTFCCCMQIIVRSINELCCPESLILVECKVNDLPANTLLVQILDGIKQRPRNSHQGVPLLESTTVLTVITTNIAQDVLPPEVP
ncbi:unnamed protein product [Ranitomeya imitator]|uniref:Uncharacterized protein n=1 Tax=Ranitomeya imitator TaxID=111125 RepID=A0ABN9L384_9NEOB|nr:unnamed protein product [Ranitomeya imitator]